ncbi:MAG TPA: 4Fe-4S dicluster domain-containing protein [Acidimicrobiales bacterium]|nr:4Fe-4S dicluster domain-containing protein [Acidimicrobiales bacterium]
MDIRGLDALIATLVELGYDTRGPVVRDGAVMPGSVRSVADLPAGFRDVQAPGSYQGHRTGDSHLFAWAVGPGSWKAEFFPPAQELWRISGDELVDPGTAPTLRPEVPSSGPPLAIVGARPCEKAALDVLARVLGDEGAGDPRFGARRHGMFLVVAECGTPAATCFCTAMGTGPGADSGFDLALTEIDDEGGHRFLVRAGTVAGADVLARVPGTSPTEPDLIARRAVLDGAAAAVTRSLPTEGLPELLERNLEHPRWVDVAGRCLACGNCTLVCPTCFCSDVRDVTTVGGDVVRKRTWASCFDLGHSFLHGGAVRASGASRYRQWLTHKLSTWWDQFDTSGCVGCGRCITWCPVGIDLTEEVGEIARSDGAVRGHEPEEVST